MTDVVIRAQNIKWIGRVAEAVVSSYAATPDEVELVFHPTSRVIDGTHLVPPRAKHVRSDSERASLPHPLSGPFRRATE